MLGTSVHDEAAQVHDPELPAVAALLGPPAVSILQAAVEPQGGSIGALRPSFIDYWPGERIHVRYDATVIHPTGIRSETLVAVARRTPPPARSIPVDIGDGFEVGVWRYMDDPSLPGIAAATDPDFVRELLATHGLPHDAISIELRGYSPRSRAVVEVAVERPNMLVFRSREGLRRARPQPILYLKVRRPERAAKVERAHRLLAGRAPVPRCSAFDEELGLLALEPLPGEALWDRLVRGSAPPPGDLLALLAGIGGASLGEPSARPTVSKGVRTNARMLRAIVPERAETLDRFVEAFGDDAPQPPVTVHRDFHEVQILVDGTGRVSGLLDLDDAGEGALVNDLAMLTGRLTCFAETHRDPDGRVRGYVQRLLDEFSEVVDGRELRRRVAGIALNHATSSFRYQSSSWRRKTRAAIDDAERLLAAAISA